MSSPIDSKAEGWKIHQIQVFPEFLKWRSPKQPKLSAKNGTMRSVKLSAHKFFDQNIPDLSNFNFFCVVKNSPEVGNRISQPEKNPWYRMTTAPSKESWLKKQTYGLVRDSSVLCKKNQENQFWRDRTWLTTTSLPVSSEKFGVPVFTSQKTDYVLSKRHGELDGLELQRWA